MKSPSKQRDILPVGLIATGFVHTMYFDMDFNYIEGRVEQKSIFPDAPDNWESETCNLIPFFRYEYTRVTKENPETSRRSLRAVVNQAKKNVKFYAKEPKKGAVLRVIRDPVVIPLPNNLEAIINVRIVYMEESLGSLRKDSITSERKTREMPPDVKEKAKAVIKKNDSTSNRRHTKRRQ
jgi:hypothetical protein